MALTGLILAIKYEGMTSVARQIKKVDMLSIRIVGRSMLMGAFVT
jgi:hypothetical protein